MDEIHKQQLWNSLVRSGVPSDLVKQAFEEAVAQYDKEQKEKENRSE